MKYGVRVVLLACLASLGCGPEPAADDEGAVAEERAALSSAGACPEGVGEFEASYLDCDEFAGVGFVPFANVAPRVPAGYVPVEAAPGSGIVVAQAARCASICVEGRFCRPATIAQFGVGIAPPTGEPGGNFYQLMFATDHPLLAARLRLLGVNARFAPRLEFAIDPGPALRVFVPRPAPLAWALDGPVTPADPSAPPNPVTTFNYWYNAPSFGNVLQQNVVTGIRFGEGSGVVLTALGDELEAIVGGPTLTFPLFSNPEVFERADLSVRTNAF
jgi:hypothetical protein